MKGKIAYIVVKKKGCKIQTELFYCYAGLLRAQIIPERTSEA